MTTATDKQINFIITLGKEVREAAATMPEESAPGNWSRKSVNIALDGWGRAVRDGGLSIGEASDMITALLELKKEIQKTNRASSDVSLHIQGCPQTAKSKRNASGEEPEPGMYTDGTRIMRVYLGQRSGKMLAKEVVQEEGDYVYQYRGLATRFIDSSFRAMTLEEAKKWGRMTGSCCVCARRLDNPESVDAGIGPVCAGRMEGGF